MQVRCSGHATAHLEARGGGWTALVLLLTMACSILLSIATVLPAEVLQGKTTQSEQFFGGARRNTRSEQYCTRAPHSPHTGQFSTKCCRHVPHFAISTVQVLDKGVAIGKRTTASPVGPVHDGPGARIACIPFESGTIPVPSGEGRRAAAVAEEGAITEARKLVRHGLPNELADDAVHGVSGEVTRERGRRRHHLAATHSSSSSWRSLPHAKLPTAVAHRAAPPPRQ